uniref:Large ribosomal subunit protein uL16m n=1 Tax=Ostreobium quekettii TaxID=121088 RepID=A0A650BXS8_9CHLO|nr:ribosomal protein L16 [Ostreobium quekettii]QGQ62009.1 ribosomal protein L16 [Ostreobium quekettii]
MLSPRRTKYRKYQKGKIVGVSPNTTPLLFGRYGIKSCSAGRLPAHTILAARLAITRIFRRSGKIWMRIFPDIQVTAKPAEVRMGKGKGYPRFWISRIKPGMILFEMDGVNKRLAKHASVIASSKLPFKTQFVQWNLV